MFSKSQSTGHLLYAWVLICSLLLTGCVTQRINLRTIKQAPSAPVANATHFQQSSYSIYLLLDLIPVKRASVETIMNRVNPQNKPVANLKVYSRENGLASVVNWLNGGIVDRGVIISLNKVTVEGDLIE
jgi:hypothetical protein